MPSQSTLCSIWRYTQTCQGYSIPALKRLPVQWIYFICSNPPFFFNSAMLFARARVMDFLDFSNSRVFHAPIKHTLFEALCAILNFPRAFLSSFSPVGRLGKKKKKKYFEAGILPTLFMSFHYSWLIRPVFF